MRLASVIALVLAAAAGTAIETSGWQASSPATVTTAPSGMPVPVAQPSIKGPAPLPSEEQGLPG